MTEKEITAVFVQYASDILADTDMGLTGSEIVKATAAYAVDCGIELPHPTYPFGSPNKRSALFDNIMVFEQEWKYKIIKELCDHKSISNSSRNDVKELQIKLARDYSYLDTSVVASEVNQTLIEETKHWLQDYPNSLSLFNQSLDKYNHRVFQRNLLDDLRLSLEVLLKAILENSKSLENQIKYIGPYIKDRNGSAELANMFQKLLDYYSKYNNSYVKHNDSVIEEEIEFVLEITSSFMKHLIRLKDKNG